MGEYQYLIKLMNDKFEGIRLQHSAQYIVPGDLIEAVAVFGNWIIFNTKEEQIKDFKYAFLYGEGKAKGELEGRKPITAAETFNYIKDGIMFSQFQSFYGGNYTYGTSSSTEGQFQGWPGVGSFIVFDDAKWRLYYQDADGTYRKQVVSGKCTDLTELNIPYNTIYKVEKLE